MLPLILGLVMLLVFAAAAAFALFAGTRQPRYKRLGLLITKWTVIAAVVCGVVWWLPASM